VTSDEPIYEFVRGVGWITNKPLDNVVTMLCGTKVRLELKRPGPGDLWDASYNHKSLEDWYSLAQTTKFSWLLDEPPIYNEQAKSYCVYVRVS
jgi:hypothetical protein